jgi:hypothetical protein
LGLGIWFKMYSTSLTCVRPWVQHQYWKEERKCEKNDLFYQSICYPLRWLSGRHLRWLACLKGPCFFFRIPVWLHCLPTACPNPSPKPFSQSGNTVNLWPGQIPGEGQVRLHQGYKEEPLSAILSLRVA